MTAEAGVLYLDLAEALEKRDMQMHVNTEIGNLTLGSAACAGTKDASIPGEFGQVKPYAIGVKMILSSGDRLEITEDAQPEVMKLARSARVFLTNAFQRATRIELAIRGKDKNDQ